MPRGAITKRSKSPGIAGPPGPAGLGPFAFANIATMAAFPAGALVDGVDAHVFTLDDVWSYDPSSTLAPDVSAAAPLGITIVSANGPGNWTRRQEASRRWIERTAWFVDPVAGSDEAAGATALTAVGTFAEVMRRISAQPPGLPTSGGYDITIMSDLAEVVLIDTRTLGGNQALYIHAAPILLFAGAITAHVDYNDATQTVGTITIAGLPVSFTASGLVGKLVRIPNGGAPFTYTEFWIMQDMGAKTARISPPQAGVFTSAVGAVTNTACEIYNLVKFGTEVTILAEGGESEQVDFETLELGTTGGAHVVEFKAGGALLDACYVNGLDIYNCEVSFFNCAFLEFRVAEGSAAILANGYCPPGGGSVQARAGGGIAVSRFASYTAYLIQQRGLLTGALVNGWALYIGAAGTAFQAEPGALIDTARGAGAPIRLWTKDMAAGTGVNVLANGRLVYDHTKPILLNAPAIQIQLGNLTRTLAQLPYTNPIDQSAIVEANSPDPVEDVFQALAVDSNVATNVFAVVMTQNIAVNGLRFILISLTYSVTVLAGTVGLIAIFIDGVQVVPSGFSATGVVVIPGAVNWGQAVADGAHVITVRWRTNAAAGQQIFCRAATELFESMTLTVRELYG